MIFQTFKRFLTFEKNTQYFAGHLGTLNNYDLSPFYY